MGVIVPDEADAPSRVERVIVAISRLVLYGWFACLALAIVLLLTVDPGGVLGTVSWWAMGGVVVGAMLVPFALLGEFVVWGNSFGNR